ncbi:FAD:protein FMN transferase [Lacticaseibacillus parakribbianus]|uniref:FAD:protein FMN transferase n=1 Tax=Lacticaseibacillus parakribbianus TaxID=2970927 RepID=UPI0021CB5D85|nr:FAD:protein FMN transferase [Lacticaseibacillus parakribbianus]
MKKWLIGCALGLALVATLAGCKPKDATPKSSASSSQAAALLNTPYEDTRFLMGTVVTLRIYDQGKSKVMTKAFDRIEALADAITVNQKGSQVDAINAAAGEKAVKVDPDVFNLVKYAKNWSEKSNGSFDLAIGPITSLWHIGFNDARKPAQSEIDAVLPLVHYQDVELNAAKRTVYLKKKGMKIDLGGIAKGYITDLATATMKANGVTTAILDLGGNIYVLGHSPKAPGKDWTIGIQDPKKTRGTSIGTLPASNQTIVTSGIYERYLKVDGKIYMHLMNPKTGYPFDNNLMGVSIITKKSVNGDALSTATFDKGLRGGLAFIEKQKDAEAIFITKDKKVYISSGLKNKFKLLKNSGYTMATLK